MLAIGELVQFEHLLHVRYLAGLLVDPGIQFIGHSLDYLRNRQVFIAASLTSPLSLIQGGKTDHAHHGSERLIALEVPANQHVLFPRSPDKDMKPLQLSPTLAAVSGWILCLLLALVTIAVVLKRRTWRTLKGKRPSTGVYASSGAGGSRDPPRNPSRRGAGDGSSSRNRRTVVEEAGEEDTVQSNGSAGHGSPPPPPPPPSFPFAIVDDWDGRSPMRIDWILLLWVIPLFALVQGLRYLIRRKRRLAASSGSGEELETFINERTRALHSEVDEHDLSGLPSANGLVGYERSNTSSGVDYVFPTCRNVLPLRRSQDVELGFWQRCFRLVTSSLVALLSFCVSRLPLLLFFIAGYYPAQNVDFAETEDADEQVAPFVELFTSALVQAPCVKVNEALEEAVAEVSVLDNVESLHAPKVAHGSDTVLEEKAKERLMNDKEVWVLDDTVFADDPLSAQSVTPDGNENDSGHDAQAALEETTVPDGKGPVNFTQADVDSLPLSAALAHEDENAVVATELPIGTKSEATTPILLLSPASSILNPSAKAFVPRSRKIEAPKPVQATAELVSVSTVSLGRDWVQPRSFNRARAKTCVQC